MKGRAWGWDRWAQVALALLALALRLPPVLGNRFHPDEALYGYWGLLIANGKDVWLAGVPVYKPPLLSYLVATAQGCFGDSEFTVRLPGLASGLLAVPLTAALSHALYRDRWAAVTAAVCVVLSPFAILFSATAFTDLPMVTLGLWACVAAARGRSGWAGLLVGLSFSAKQTGLFWLPLVILFQISNLQPPVSNLQSPLPNSPLHVRRWALFIVNCSFIIGLVFAWDAVRLAQGAEGFWSVGVTGYGGLRLIWPQEVWSRLGGWAALARYLFVSPAVNGVLLIGLPVLVWRALTRLHRTGEALVDLFLVSFLLAYLLLHWLRAFILWDRYLLPLVPVLAILMGRILALLSRCIQRMISRWPLIIRRLSFVIVCCSLFLALAFPAWIAAHSHYPVGGDHGAYDGIDKLAGFLNEAPEGTVLYQHWLGWEYDYYLFGGPVSLAYWPTPAWLAQDVQAFGAGDLRYITFPSWESSARVERALAEVGYGLEPVLTTTRRDGALSFTLYRIRSFSPADDPANQSTN